MFFKDLFRHMVVGILISSFLAISIIPSGCAVNPATKKRELMLVSEEREFRIGQKVDKQVREDMGVYLELPGLRSLVKEVGEKIGRNSDRSKLIYRFEIVDSPDINAFALPGGFIYINRGLLERMNSLDELASVMGHEVAHVAARHSAAQISKAQLLNIGLLGAAIATKGAVQDYGQLINIGAVLVFNKFSRDAEREADLFGTRYMVRSGYNPKASIDVMNQFKRLELKEPSTMDAWFMTHPPTKERIVNINYALDEIRSTQAEALNKEIKRNQFIQLLDGLAVGEWNGNELIKGEYYYNKEFLLKIRIPVGWQSHINAKQYVAVFQQAKKQFIAFFNIEPLRTRKTAREYFKDFDEKIRRMGLKREIAPESDRVLRHNALSGLYKGTNRSGDTISAESIVFVKGTNGFSFFGYCKKSDFGKLRPALESMIKDLYFISEKEVSEFQPPRLHIHRVKRGETWTGIAKKYYKSSSGTKKLAEYNGFDVSQTLRSGILLKIPPSLRFR